MEVISEPQSQEDTDVLDSAPGSTPEHPLPRELGACVLIHNFLSGAECKALIEAAEVRGFASAELDYPPSYRNNDRQVLNDRALADRLLQRLANALPHGPEGLLPDGLTEDWQLEGINERLRLCRYRSGQQFHIHQDGVHHRGPHCRSMLTFMVYLTDGSDFEGGDTLFYGAGPSRGEDEQDVVARVRPKAGSLILFDHGIWHAGAEVTRGTKYVLRSDLLFRRTESGNEGSFAASHHQGYIWTLAALKDGRLASGGRDGSIRIWNPDGELSGVLAGHDQSVLGLTEVHPGVIASISRDRTLHFWDVASRSCLQSISAHKAAVLSMACLPGQAIATGGADHAIRLWSERGELLRTLMGHEGWVWGLARLERDLLASASEDHSVRIWDIRDDQCIATLRVAHPLRTIDTRRSSSAHDMPTLAVGDASGRVTLWLMNQGNARELTSFMAHAAAVRRVRFLRNGALATCGEDNRLRIWSATSLELIHEEVRSNFVTDVIELRDGTRVSCGYDGELRWS